MYVENANTITTSPCYDVLIDQKALLKTGAVPLLGKLLATDNVDVLIPVVGTLQECASEVRETPIIIAIVKIKYSVNVQWSWYGI